MKRKKTLKMLVDYDDSDSESEKNDEEPIVASSTSATSTTSSTSSSPFSSSIPKAQPPPRKLPPITTKRGQDGVISLALPILLNLNKKRKQDGNNTTEDENSSDEDAGVTQKRAKTAGVSLSSLLPPPKNSAKSDSISISPSILASSSTPVASLLSRARFISSDTSSSSSSPTFSSPVSTVTPSLRLPQPQPLQSSQPSQQVLVAPYYEEAEAPEPSPNFLPKHLRDSFQREQVKVIEIKQTDLRVGPGGGFGGTSLPSVAHSSAPKASSVHKKKHQIGYLASEAMAKEAELAEKRNAGLKAKNQVRSKYGW
jgi:hypothetical protein